MAELKLRPLLKKWYYSHWPRWAGSFPYFGTRVYFPKNSHLFLRVCEEDIYEKRNLRFLTAYVRPNTTYFDVGANIGLMATPILHKIQSCRIVSFEPSPSALPYLLKTNEGSPFKSRWQVIPKAVGARQETLEFYTAGPENSAFDGLRNTGRAAGSTSVKVPVTTLDIEWESLGRPKISVIKVDVEGAELDVLRGAEKCIRSERPMILMEWAQSNLEAYGIGAEGLLVLAEQLNYGVYSFPAGILITSKEMLELQMLTTFDFILLPRST